MTTADVVRDTAMMLARNDTDPEQAVRELEAACEGRRVAAVRARQQLAATLDDDVVDVDVQRAITFLDEVLERLPA